MDLGEEATRTVPVSPVGQYFNTSKLSMSILVVLELEVPVDESQILPWLNRVFVPIHPRFSSIMITDEKGLRGWKRVEVKVENHVKIPIFLSRSSLDNELYDEESQEYVSDVGGQQFVQTQPMWEIHIVKYPTRNSPSTVIFKIHHALGDGFSLMGALLSCFQRADDPSLPLSFLAARKPNKPPLRGVEKVSSLVIGIKDFCWSTLKSTLMPDGVTTIRSGKPELSPISISSITFSHSDLKQIKSNLGVTINDVVVGIIFLGCRLYMKNMGEEAAGSRRSTALVLLNMRDVASYQPVTEMMKPGSSAPWGNRFSTLHIPLTKPSDPESMSNPLEFVTKVHRAIQKKRTSSSIHLNRWLLQTITKIKGPEAGSKFVRRKIKNSSILVTNMIGPKEQMAFANHPVKDFYFMLAGCPQSLIFAVMTYMGKLKIAIGAEKGFINTQNLHASIQSAFEMIFKAASQIPSQPS